MSEAKKLGSSKNQKTSKSLENASKKLSQPNYGKFLLETTVKAAVLGGSVAVALKCAENLNEQYQSDSNGRLTKKPSNWKERGEAAANLIGYMAGIGGMAASTVSIVDGTVDILAARRLEKALNKKK